MFAYKRNQYTNRDVPGYLDVMGIALGTSTTNCSVAYDGNGNVGALVDSTSGKWSARYEYGPFGEPIRATGPMADYNPFRFSTKYEDSESDLLYYGYRFYNADLGRWINRDPIDEVGHRTMQKRDRVQGRIIDSNAYCFVNNDPSTRIDLLGESLADLAAKRAGRQVPKAVGVQAGGILAVKIPFISRTVGLGAGVGVYFFPDSCEVGAFTIRAGIGSGIDDIVWYEIGAVAGIGGALEGAIYIGNSTPGAANAGSFAGVFHTVGVAHPVVSGGAYIGNPDASGGRWLGGQLGAGPGIGVMAIAWNYQPIGAVKVPLCLCYTAILGI